MRLGSHKIFPVGNAQIEIADLIISARFGQALQDMSLLKLRRRMAWPGKINGVDAVLNGRISSPSFSSAG